jgi:hypothetical protein
MMAGSSIYKFTFPLLEQEIDVGTKAEKVMLCASPLLQAKLRHNGATHLHPAGTFEASGRDGRIANYRILGPVNGPKPVLSPHTVTLSFSRAGQSHSKTKRKRRQKSDKRKDYTAATMAKLKQLEQAAAGT